MASLNRVTIIGNIGSDPELRYMAGGEAQTHLAVVTTDRISARETRTEWHTVVLNGRLAEVATEVLRKGSRTYLEGRLQTRSWMGSDGSTRYRTEIICNHLQLLDGRGIEVPA